MFILLPTTPIAAQAARAIPPFGRRVEIPPGISIPFVTHQGTSSSQLTGAGLLAPVASLPLMSLDEEQLKFGTDQRVAPPDTMLAAGPRALLEMVNRSASVWTKTGTLSGAVDLDKALPLPSGFSFSDPRVLFDASSGRFFFTGAGTDAANDSLVFVGVSKTSDPGGGFYVNSLAQTSNGELHDQPKPGVNDDKLVITWDDFLPGSVYAGSETWVLQKSTLLNGAATPAVVLGPTAGQISSVPAQSLTSTTTEYLIHDGGNFASVRSINGTPANNDVTMTENDIPIPLVNPPTPAVQPGGGTLDTGDYRFLSAVWSQGMLWTSGNDGCVPPGTTVERACSRVIQVSTTGSPSLLKSVDLSFSNADVYYPAVLVTGTGDAFVSVSTSSASLFVSAAAIELKAGTTTPVSTVFERGVQTYSGSSWGDYSAVALDPVSGDVWAAAEYMASGSSRNWGTAAAEFPS